MKAFAAPMSVGDYCQDMVDQKIIVNLDYQRSPKIWKGEARSFFIESIILGFPIPKIFLNSKLTLKTRQTIKEIVDGQQRSTALRDFYLNKLRLSKNIETEEIRGKNYNGLPDEYKEAFLSYSLPIDQFINVVDVDVREAFRRMNSNNVPLNEEEKRHARYQGPFKWFINTIATEFRNQFVTAGVLSKRDFIRMSDYKLITDIVFAIKHGVQTTKAKELNSLYAEYDNEFPDQEVCEDIVRTSLTRAMSVEELVGTALFKQHIFYSLTLAQAAIHYAIPVLLESEERGKIASAAQGDIGTLEFGDLLELLENSDANAAHPFVKACAEKTNVKEPRDIRLAYLKAAIELQREADH